MAITHCPNCHFVLFEFLHICFIIYNWLHNCTGGKLLLYVAGKMSIMRYPKGMPFIILKLKGKKTEMDCDLPHVYTDWYFVTVSSREY